MARSYSSLFLFSAALMSGPAEHNPPEMGSIVGTVKVRSVSKVPPLEVTADTGVCGEELPSESLLATPQGRVRNAVVSLNGVASPGKPNLTPMKIVNQKCAFYPHVQAGIAGSRLEAINRDPIMHNVRLFLQMGSRGRSMLNLALPANAGPVDASRGVVVPGIINVQCDAHEWMTGYIVLFDHPYYAVTDHEGDFMISNVPPGNHTLTVWHEILGESSIPVKVEAGREVGVVVNF
jgi:hypothetical protein